MKIEQIARLCHETVRMYSMSLGDGTTPMWEQAPEAIRQSCIEGVKAHIKDPNLSPEESHNRWMAARNADGWKWGPVKDWNTKEHPNLKAYNLLPPEQRSKDYIFKAIVNTLMTMK